MHWDHCRCCGNDAVDGSLDKAKRTENASKMPAYWDEAKGETQYIYIYAIRQHCGLTAIRVSLATLPMRASHQDCTFLSASLHGIVTVQRVCLNRSIDRSLDPIIRLFGSSNRNSNQRFIDQSEIFFCADCEGMVRRSILGFDRVGPTNAATIEEKRFKSKSTTVNNSNYSISTLLL